MEDNELTINAELFNNDLDDLGFKRSEFAKSLILQELDRLEKMKK